MAQSEQTHAISGELGQFISIATGTSDWLYSGRIVEGVIGFLCRGHCGALDCVIYKSIATETGYFAIAGI